MSMKQSMVQNIEPRQLLLQLLQHDLLISEEIINPKVISDEQLPLIQAILDYRDELSERAKSMIKLTAQINKVNKELRRNKESLDTLRGFEDDFGRCKKEFDELLSIHNESVRDPELGKGVNFYTFHYVERRGQAPRGLGRKLYDIGLPRFCRRLAYRSFN